MLRITRETDYGIVLLSYMVQEMVQDILQDHTRAYSATQLAKQCHLPLPMVSKVLKTLTQGEVLVSQRGAQGGYSLARPAAMISVADIIEAIEGPIAMTECSVADPQACNYLEHCHVSSHWNRINEAIREALQNISLAEMSKLPTANMTAVVQWLPDATNLTNATSAINEV